MNILILCTGNSARSILLESILNTYGDGRVRAWSAGSHPTGAVHPQSLKLLEHLGHDVTDARSKSWDEFATSDAPKMDVVITVCTSAAGETCPIWPGAPIRTHWGIDDPAAAAPVDWDTAFDHAYKKLEHKARAFLAQDFEKMDKHQLRSVLDAIGEMP